MAQTLQSELASGNAANAEKCLELLSFLSKSGEPAVEPYLMPLLPLVLQKCSDKVCLPLVAVSTPALAPSPWLPRAKNMSSPVSFQPSSLLYIPCLRPAHPTQPKSCDLPSRATCHNAVCSVLPDGAGACCC